VAEPRRRAEPESDPDLLAMDSPPPRLPGTVSVLASADEAIDALAADLVFQATTCVRTFGDFHLALSGGTTPEPLYRRLMYDPAFRDLPWKRTHLWQVDERLVLPDDPRSNFGMIRDLVVEPSDIPPAQVHAVDTSSPTPDEDYERVLREELEWREKGHDRLDYVLLGLGEDGHTASLFPRSGALEDRGRLVLVNDGPGVTPPPRVTMTLCLINAARLVAVLVTGERKRGAVARVAAGKESPRDLPMLGVRPLAGELRWYLDMAACPK
jgi:6-phosphogluconolactonase